jgi:hypothetical protein
MKYLIPFALFILFLVVAAPSFNPGPVGTNLQPTGVTEEIVITGVTQFHSCRDTNATSLLVQFWGGDARWLYGQAPEADNGFLVGEAVNDAMIVTPYFLSGVSIINVSSAATAYVVHMR